MSVRFGWSIGQGLSAQQYLRGVNHIPGDELVAPGDPNDDASGDGPEEDTIPDFDARACSMVAWATMDHLPASSDPNGSLIREKYGLWSRDCLQCGFGGSTLQQPIALNFQGTSAGPPRLYFVMTSDNFVPIASTVTGDLPTSLSDPDYWIMVAATNVLGASPGPRLFWGDLATVVAEFGSYSNQDTGDLPPSLVGRGVNALTGNFVDRWFYGPGLIGQMARPISYYVPVNGSGDPINGPGQHYGLANGGGDSGHGNSGYGPHQGRIANVSLWNGALTIDMLEWLRQNRGSFGVGLTPAPGDFPPLVANWSLGSDLFDRSGRGHHLQMSAPMFFDTQPSSDPIVPTSDRSRNQNVGGGSLILAPPPAGRLDGRRIIETRKNRKGLIW